MNERRRVARRGGVVFRGGNPHLRRDHTTTVPGSDSTASNTVRPDVMGLLGDDEPQPKQPKPLGVFGVNAYDALISLRRGRGVRLGGGRGVARFIKQIGGNRVGRVGPHTNIKDPSTVFSGGFSGFDLSNSTFSFGAMYRFDFSDSTLDGSVFDVNPASFNPRMLIDNTSWRGASLRNVAFRNVVLTGYSDFRDADVAGMEIPEFFSGVEVDFRGSNITGEQFDDVVAKMPVEHTETGQPVYGNRYKITYDKHTLSEAAALTGLDEETLGVLIWTGEIQVRHGISSKVVDPSEFSPSAHVIPGWELHKLTGGAQRGDVPGGDA